MRKIQSVLFLVFTAAIFVHTYAQMAVYAPLPDTEYHIINISSGKYLTCEATNDIYFAKHLVFTEGNVSQKFTFTKLSDNTYQIKCVGTGLNMYRSSNGWDVKFSSSTSGTAAWILEEYYGNILIKQDNSNHLGIDETGDGVYWNKSWSTTRRLQWKIVAVVNNPAQAADINYPVQFAEALTEEDWGVPSWTMMLEAYRATKSSPTVANTDTLKSVLQRMLRKDVPYAVNAVVNGDLTSRIGLSWYTNENVTGGMAQLVAKSGATENDFNNSPILVNAISEPVNSIYYLTSSHTEVSLATGIPLYTLKSYTSNKALIIGLNPNTIYSYRVGKPNAWSEIRSFKTGKPDKSNFSFIYITDTQANNVADFNTSKNTINAATIVNPNPEFVMVLGDMIESSGSENSEWEYEKWFSIMDKTLAHSPMVLTNGNHDLNSNLSLSKHTNTDRTFDSKLNGTSTMPGMTYSFVRGEALFFVVNFEDYYYSNFYDALDKYMAEKIAEHPDVKWRILCCHAGMYTGSSRHHTSSMAKEIRRYFSPVMQKHRIDLALHGHSHVYEVIGPVNNTTKTILQNSATEQEISIPVYPENSTGKKNGVYNVNGGTLYFLNNSAGKKKYALLTKEEIDNETQNNEVPDYWSLFSGRMAYTPDPTFSNVTIAKDTITIATYTVNDAGNSEPFDKIKIVRNTFFTNTNCHLSNDKIHVDYLTKAIIFDGSANSTFQIIDTQSRIIYSAKNTNFVSFNSLANGIYIVRVIANDQTYITKFLVK